MEDSKKQIKELIESHFTIVDKQSHDVKFVLKPAQQKFLDQMTGRDIILKARQEGFCLDTSTKILTDKCKWITAGEIEVGQKIVAVDEMPSGGKGFGRKMRTAVVEAKRVVHEDSVKLTMKNGETLIATTEHRFMTKLRGGVGTLWRKTKKIKVGDEIRYITKPWSESTKEDYWFAGVLDGEGSLRQKKSGGVEVCISQVAGPVLDRLIKYAIDNGYSYRLDWDMREAGEKSKLGNKPVGRLVFNRMNEIFELIGKTRPTRFVGKEWWLGKDLPGKRSSQAWCSVVKVEPLGKRKMVDIQTSTKTFIANGFVSHNSSLILAIFTYDFLFKPNSVSMSISYETGAAQKLLDKVKHYIEPLGIPMKYNSRNEMYNEAIGSTFYIGTAAAVTTGRGQTITNLHASEVAFYKDADTLMTGLLQSVPKEGRVIMETTANGMGNYFHREWQKATSNGSTFTPHFFSWREDPDYAKPIIRNEFKLSNDEVEFMAQHGLSREQIAWMRDKKKEFKSDDEFNQEYPITPRVAFISSGNPVFDMHTLDLMDKTTKEPKYTGNLVGNRTRITLEQTKNGYLKVYEEPREYDQYVIGADVAESNDFSSAHVIKRSNMEVVAVWHGHIAPDLFGKELERLGYFYNTAFLGVERNNQGIATLVILNQLYYPNLYFREDTNDVGETSTSKLGWETNIRTRPVLVSDLGMYIRNRDIQIPDKGTIQELMTFVKDEKGKPVAQNGCHDDRVISLAISVQMYKRSPQTKSENPMVTYVQDAEYGNDWSGRRKTFDNY